jgi:hypothetical protein
MAIITTKSIADSKPITPLDWCGNPIKDGRSYWGADAQQEAPPSPVKAVPTRRKRVSATMSPERRAAFGARMREYWQRKRGITSDNDSNVKSNPVDSEGLTPDAT